MKILALADEEAKRFYDFYKPGILDSYDLILACGDLNRSYLEFIVTMAHCPVLYVPGNHDEAFMQEPPGGCICVDDMIYEYKGIRILGLGGCHKYKDGVYMYTERQMRWRILKLRRKLRKSKGFDILITHAPARHLNDFESQTHRGFECFHQLLDRYEPKFFVHGHIHRNYGVAIPRKTKHNHTMVINAYEYYEFDYPATSES